MPWRQTQCYMEAAWLQPARGLPVHTDADKCTWQPHQQAKKRAQLCASVYYPLTSGQQIPDNGSNQVQGDGNPPHVIPAAVLQDPASDCCAQDSSQDASCVAHAQKHTGIPWPDVLCEPEVSAMCCSRGLGILASSPE